MRSQIKTRRLSSDNMPINWRSNFTATSKMAQSELFRPVVLLFLLHIPLSLGLFITSKAYPGYKHYRISKLI